MKLLLFDIDGTILLTKGVGRRSVEQALSHLCQRSISTKHVSFSGKTDPQIMQDVLLRNGLPASDMATLLPRALKVYAETARRTITPRAMHVLPGVRDLIARLAGDNDVQLGLLTGNLEETAYLKLEAAGLAGYFPFGAFGSDHADREALPPVAVRRARAHTGRTFDGKDVVIIGDSENDILCGRGIGAFAVAVCTGFQSRADLEPHGPDLLLDDLRNHDLFVRRVVRPAA
ncbi:MAG: HAD family hydrolase [Rhodothermales bacterium]